MTSSQDSGTTGTAGSGEPVTPDPIAGEPSAPVARLRVQRVRPAYRQVADDLRGQIMRGAVGAGERLPSETELGSAFGVSRSTVREALRVLASQHLIETRRGVRGGSFVAAPDPARIVEDIGGALGVLVTTPHLRMEDLLEARLLLEPAAARLAAQRADDETVEAVRSAALAPEDPDDPSGFVPHLDFHTTVLMATGNTMFTMMGQPVHDVLRTRLDRDRVAREEWAAVDECHRDIAEHIAAGADTAAEEAMREHLLALRELYRRAGRFGDSEA
ncbi:FadR/GntR family transcriptional regulator [Pseudonocardia endophytica]|uniref:GntR family transcriptional regulator n=1 Tax=Pseudonocardia endophytica TaxID=401976 RepID=A0A4R1I172_PSEEN|nr:FCD domain-containing protein [Pseudonocardia endophytica]TCK27285.1 GntR family transcriptional regulator [Pseudonocardia endophytica]